MDLQHKVAIVTGASAGIGKATAIALARERSRIVLTARRKERLEEVRKQIEAAGGQAIVVQADVSETSEVERLVQETISKFQRIDILINNAGSGLLAKVEETSVEQMEQLMRTNFISTFAAIRAVLPVMKQQGSGHIVTICSIAGRRATPLQAAYCATKFAQAGLMESLRMELRNTPIHCTTIFPGPTDTEFLSTMENPGKRPARYYGKVLDPSDVASQILRALKNPKSEVITQPFGRLLLTLNAVSPTAIDWIVARFIKRKLLEEE